MEANYIVTPSLGTKDDLGLENIQAELLLLTKMNGMGFGPGPKAVDRKVGGALTGTLRQRKFVGKVGESVVVEINDDEGIIVVGLGTAAQFEARSLCKAVSIAVDKALELDRRLTIPFVPNALSGITLTGQVHIIREVVASKLAERPEDGSFEVEFVCSRQAKRYIDAGLAIPLTNETPCCAAE